MTLNMRCYENIIELIVSPVDIQMTAKEYEYIADIVCSRNGCNLLVFGVGRDSALWLIANQGGKTVFLEDSDKWLDKAKKRFLKSMQERSLIVQKDRIGKRFTGGVIRSTDSIFLRMFLIRNGM